MESRIRAELRAAALNAAKEAVENPNIPIERGAARPVAERVVREVGPIVDHLTNAEAWWRSRVTLGSLTGVVGGIITIGTGIAAGSLDAELYAGGVAAVLGGGFALWGRWMASRPLGT